MSQSQELWVGEVAGRVLVFDAKLQLPSSPYLYLWTPSNRQVDRYIAQTLRPQIKKLSDPTAAGAHATAYRDWFEASGASWLVAEAKELQSEDARQQRTQDPAGGEQEAEALDLTSREKAMLQRHGRSEHDVRRAGDDGPEERITHCRSCKASLDGSDNLVCRRCSWLLCTCGTCGCGFNRT